MVNNILTDHSHLIPLGQSQPVCRRHEKLPTEHNRLSAVNCNFLTHAVTLAWMNPEIATPLVIVLTRAPVWSAPKINQLLIRDDPEIFSIRRVCRHENSVLRVLCAVNTTSLWIFINDVILDNVNTLPISLPWLNLRIYHLLVLVLPTQEMSFTTFNFPKDSPGRYSASLCM